MTIAMISIDFLRWSKQKLRTVDALQSQNNELKRQLSEILIHDLDRDTLEKLEQFQTQILYKDITFSLLRHELLMHMNGWGKDGLNDELSDRQQHKFEQDLLRMEMEIIRMYTELENLKRINKWSA